MKIYISGKITGLNYQEARLKFFEAAKHCYYVYKAEVCNPIQLVHYDENKIWQNYMKEAVIYLCQCDTIYMLDDWKNSDGAIIEHDLAKKLGYEIIYQNNVK
jgi:hypothetical protein